MNAGSGRWDSNPRHLAWEASALPTELRPRSQDSSRVRRFGPSRHARSCPKRRPGGRAATHGPLIAGGRVSRARPEADPRRPSSYRQLAAVPGAPRTVGDNAVASRVDRLGHAACFVSPLPVPSHSGHSPGARAPERRSACGGGRAARESCEEACPVLASPDRTRLGLSRAPQLRAGATSSARADPPRRFTCRRRLKRGRRHRNIVLGRNAVRSIRGVRVHSVGPVRRT